ncbi:MAG TPA: DivIVA domain-containing protein [candidate division Zixibacteria bacterium]|nr:DivIVA domain-containing protein [candidate division Zixibacteria bacterium]
MGCIMGLTPNEIRNQEFSSSMRGYTRSEVEAFKDAAAAALEEAKVEILKLTEANKALEAKYRDLKNLEETLKSSVVEAQKSAEQTVNNSRKEAELIISDAKRKRDDIIEEKHRKLAELETRIHELEFTRKSFYARLKSEFESYLKLIEQAESDRSMEIKRPDDPAINRIAEHIQHNTTAKED